MVERSQVIQDLTAQDAEDKKRKEAEQVKHGIQIIQWLTKPQEVHICVACQKLATEVTHMVGLVAKLAICDECIELCHEILTETRAKYEIIRTWCPIAKWSPEELADLMRFCVEQKDAKVTTLLLPEGQTLILYKGEEAKTAGQVGRLIEAINLRKTGE